MAVGASYINLAVNARKAMQDGGLFVIKSENRQVARSFEINGETVEPGSTSYFPSRIAFWESFRYTAAYLRAVLYDQGSRFRDRTRPVDGVWNCDANRRPYSG